MTATKRYDCFLMGTSTRLIRCAEILGQRGHRILGIVSDEPSVREWAEEAAVRLLEPRDDLQAILESEPFDLFFSIDNTWKVPEGVLSLPRTFPVNFHDAPLPRYAGANATNWAIMNGERSHGITWHVMSAQIDAGDILKQVTFEISEDETALTLNAKCYEKSIEAFAELMEDLERDRVRPTRQNLEDRTYFPRWKRPEGACTIDWGRSAKEIDAAVRGLEHGSYPNPLGTAKLYLHTGPVVVRELAVTSSVSTFAPGTVVKAAHGGIRVATKTRDVVVTRLTTLAGGPLDPRTLMATSGLKEGDRLPGLTRQQLEDISRVNAGYCRYEGYWVERLRNLEIGRIPYAKTGTAPGGGRRYVEKRLSVAAAGAKGGDHLFASLALYLLRLCGKTRMDIAFRDATLKQSLSGAEAHFAAHVPLRIGVDDASGFQEFRDRIRQRVRDSSTYGSYALDLLLRYPGLTEALKDPETLRMPCAVERVESLAQRADESDADLVVVIPDDGTESAWWYDPGALAPEAVARMQAQFTAVLEATARGEDRPVSTVSILPESERRLLETWNQTHADYPEDMLLHQLVEAQVQRTPEAAAVTFEGRHLSYRQLDERANQLARRLRGLGVGPDTLVGVCMDRSAEMVIALYAILKAGGAYVPIDPEYPPERLDFMREDADVPVLLAQSWIASRLSFRDSEILCLDTDWGTVSNEDRTKPPDSIGASNLAYMIYTSGSTGKPKGALNTHRGICNRLLWMQSQFSLTAEDRVLQKTPYSFDVSVWEFFWPLLAGARLVVARPGGHRDAAYLVRTIEEQHITVMHFVPSMLRVFLEEPGVEECRSLRHVIASGEELPFDLQEQFFKRLRSQLHNLYGPTEAAVDVTYWTCRPGGTRRFVPIGRPVANTQIHILGPDRQPMPPGVPGELYIGGVQVGRGYHNRPELTAERFLPDPFHSSEGARIYRTGDLGRWLDDGSVEYLGRTDFQVKIRGMRVELGEIEEAMRQSPGVRDAVVALREDTPGGGRLVGYVLHKPSEGIDADELREFLRQRLPEQMVPAAYVTLTEFPLTPSGKIDRRTLPAPQGGRHIRTTLLAPRGEAQGRVAELWRELLGVSSVGVKDNFFDIGGNSLLIIKLSSRLEKIFGKRVSVVDLFRRPTIEEQAGLLVGEPVPNDRKFQDALDRARKQKASLGRGGMRMRAVPAKEKQ